MAQLTFDLVANDKASGPVKTLGESFDGTRQKLDRFNDAGDRATSGSRRLGREANTLGAKLDGASKRSGVLAKSMGLVAGATQRAGSIMSLAGKAAGAGIAGGAIVATVGLGSLIGWIAQGVKDARSYQVVLAKTGAVLKSTGNTAGTSVRGIKALAASLETLSGVDEELIINSQNVLATFTNIRNVGRNRIFDQATKSALDMSVALGTDLQGASIQVGKALNDPIKGVTALQRVGVSFTAQQREQIAAMVEAGNTMGAQKLILAELNKEFGGQAAAAGATFEGSMARAKDAISDTGREIGIALLPTLTKAADWLAKRIPQAVEDFKAGFNGVETATSMGNIGESAKRVYGQLKLLGAWASSPEGGEAIGSWAEGTAEGFANLVYWAAQFSTGMRFLGATWDHLGATLQLSWVKTVNEIIDTGAKLPGPLGRSFRKSQQEAHERLRMIQADFDRTNTRLAQTEVDALDNTIRNLKGKTVKTQAEKRELERSIRKVRELIAANAALTSKTVRVNVITTRTTRQLNAINNDRVPGGARARGGPVSAGVPYLVGEEGPELVVPKASAQMFDAATTRALLAGSRPTSAGFAGATALGGGAPTYITINMPPGSDGADVVRAIREYEKRNGKGWRN